MSTSAPPRVFMSYAHLSQRHMTWVRGLSARLRENGVDVQLDQWNNTLGTNLMQFMESGLRNSDRVIAIVSDVYRDKTDGRHGGSGYEGQILSSEMLADQTSTRVIPIIRDNSCSDFTAAMPSFLKGYAGLDMRDDALFEGNYETLLRDIHHRPAHVAPPIGPNPFETPPEYMTPPLSQQPSAYASTAMHGVVEFVHEDNNGSFAIGDGVRLFNTKWSVAGVGSVYAYTDGAGIAAIALAHGVCTPWSISDAGAYPRNSRSRHAAVGDCILWLNAAGYWAATVIQQVTGVPRSSLRFEYWIMPTRASDLSTLVYAPAAEADAGPKQGID